MSDKRIPKPGEVWTLKGTGVTTEIVNVYPDCLTFHYDGDVCVRTLDDFLDRYTPPEPTVDLIECVWHGPRGFYVAPPGMTQPRGHVQVTTIAAMSDGTFRFEAAS